MTWVSAEEAAQMVRLYARGVSCRAIAQASGRSLSTVYDHVWAAVNKHDARTTPDRADTSGVRDPAPRRPLTTVRGPEHAEILRLHQAGFTLSAIAKLTGRSTSTIFRHVHQPAPRHPTAIRHWCGRTTTHRPHVGCNGHGRHAGPSSGLCATPSPHPPHTSCDGQGNPFVCREPPNPS